MSDIKQAARLALQALIRAQFELRGITATQDMSEAADALRAALEQPERTLTPFWPDVPIFHYGHKGCSICGLGADGRTMGYVCSRIDCPTRVTCGGAA